ncbi:MAG: hypothetical protein C0616_10240 [Desulfuromonas sp.]|nr:MAG: hypothetical protein C0616_10240 [Desulfuromonas sp.]
MKFAFGGLLAAGVLLSGCAGITGKDIGQNDVQICKAGISTVMKRKPAHLAVKDQDKQAVYLAIVENGVEQKWGYKCRVEGDRVVWGAENGRWMTDRKDATVTYKVEGDTLTVMQMFYQGGRRVKTFSLEGLGK